MNASSFAQIVARLLDWCVDHQRALPWRNAPAGARNPYAVWISEVMLQQTRVETVEAYYRRWMERFPTVQALAAADLQEVLKFWEGLGYYARARNLHRAAQEVVQRHGGEIPSNRSALLALPGVGEYTVGAILSIAYNQPEPILDGNVKRVLTRLFDIDRPVDERATVRQLWELARSLVEAGPPGRAGDCNEALMELGATLCTPQNPRCLICPLAECCQAAQQGTQHQRPVRSARKETPHYDVAAGVIWAGQPFRSRLLMAQRRPEGLLGGLWEFPGGKLEPHDADLPACLRREIDEELGIEIAVLKPLTTVKHAYTHFRITLHAFHAQHVGGAPQALGCQDWRWLELDEVEMLPLPVTDQKIHRALLAQRSVGTGV
ncbi:MULTISPECIES: A/G-specific adenine glycosylase [Caldilinea]|jgi:A/G-specific adenine glycosylase|uniref:Adenine DNA glycosylase n=1 Tax=Caldilinea aerophila (strain DSM 14535 / JCM 11387 / NBRC 104270 / STL-6-O1) TaxID=926550 RepID=I0I0F2_CALAS|nr:MULTISPECIES: A/G-specific adenine glycosylase [Caldilinea]MBO9391615.1 A/G-specific adenine glycosylase [Caldilinea sp.]BAL98739.1 A/G-specific adenine glycosylase [Caldilinea aerophila DSM 14535 = NBRC 104270]GIV74674.1 MAG: A/G-specific adenine glycosylase [Caldilinea sp.]